MVSLIEPQMEYRSFHLGACVEITLNCFGHERPVGTEMSQASTP